MDASAGPGVDRNDRPIFTQAASTRRKPRIRLPMAGKQNQRQTTINLKPHRFGDGALRGYLRGRTGNRDLFPVVLTQLSAAALAWLQSTSSITNRTGHRPSH